MQVLALYGYVVAGKFIETGATLRGAKIAATRAGISTVCYKNKINGLVYAASTKDGAKWS
jgi:hypothetical protein